VKNQQKFIVPLREISEKFSRSAGKGGQNVNKLATKSEARWGVKKSAAFTFEEKEKIKKILAARINKEGELIVAAQEGRTQKQNRKLAVERLNNLVKKALVEKRKRRPTRPTRTSQERRLAKKKRISEKKFLRKISY
jgi:ribosome-associated protein